jgi:GT2 family glycosyltransferase
MEPRAVPTPLVSVIVPTYNRAALVCRAIDSALQQTHTNMEVVVVDDGSTDDTPALLPRRYEHDPRVRYVRVENGGVARARNIGIKNAKGDFVGFLDSDDYWLPWKIELQLKCLELLPEAGMIWTDMDAVNDDGAVVHARYLRHMYGAYSQLAKLGIPLFTDVRSLDAQDLGISGLTATFELSQGNIFSQMIVGSVVHTSTCLLRRERLQKVGGFWEELQVSGEDYDFHLRTCREGAVAFADIATIGYTIGRSDQLTSSPRIVYLALNSIRTLQRALRDSGALINLPPGTVARVLSGQHAWAARELLDSQRRVEARAHALESIRHNPVAMRSYALLAACLLPASGLKVARGLYRAIRIGYTGLRGGPGSS